MKPQYCSRVQRWSEMNWAGWVSPVAASRPQARLCPAGGAVWAAACWSLRDPLVCTRRNQLHCSAEKHAISLFPERRKPASVRAGRAFTYFSTPPLWKRNWVLWRKCMCLLEQKRETWTLAENPPCFHFSDPVYSSGWEAWRKRSVPEMIEH